MKKMNRKSVDRKLARRVSREAKKGLAIKRVRAFASSLRRVARIFKNHFRAADTLDAPPLSEGQERYKRTRAFTNWQLTQWNYAGCPRDIESVRRFSVLKKGG